MNIRPPLEELKEAKLYNYLASIDVDYSDRIVSFVDGIFPILATIINYFPYYTRHDAHHGFRVVQRIHQILDPDCFVYSEPKALTAAEVFLLIASAYAHDLGMTVFPGESQLFADMLGIRPEELQTSDTARLYLREHHSKRGGDYINDNASRLRVPVNLISPLDWMMKSHNLSIPELDDALAKPFAAQEKVVDVRQLATFLCIADALEFSDTRVLDGVLDLLKADASPEARRSYLENMKHICIGDSVAIDSDGRVVVSGTFSDAEVLSIAHHTFDQMEEWVRGYCDIERSSSVRRLRVRPEPISRNLELRSARFERLGVRMSKTSVIDLIASNAIWKQNSGVAIRELVQNAVEACRYRSYHTPASYLYTPQIKLVFDREARTIAVYDNGCGMSERVVLNHLLSVGKSRSRDPGYAASNYFPIARFGIGFWSVFTIASSAEIATASFEHGTVANKVNGVNFDIALHELKDYTVFTPKELPVGTTVTLRLLPDVVIDDVYEKFKSQMLCSEIPISLFLDGEEGAIPTVIPEITEKDIFGSRHRLKDELDIKFFTWRGSAGNTDLTLGLAYTLRDNQASFLKDEHNSVSMILPRGITHSNTSLCGFTVSAGPLALCFDLHRVGKFSANCRTPRGFEFTIDRNSLLRNDASKAYSSEITALIHDGYRAFLDETRSSNPETIFNLSRQAAMHGGNVYDTFTKQELNYALVNYPDLLCFRLYQVEVDKKLDACGVEYLNLNQLTEKKGAINFIQNSAETHRIGESRGIYIEAERLTELTYQYAQGILSGGATSHSLFVGDANRQMSMLFDADPTSTAEVFNLRSDADQVLPICVQRVDLSNIKYDCSQQNILSEVSGPWSGTLYTRSFRTPTRKPYLFLGRYRVLIQPSTPLHSHIAQLAQAGRLIKIAELVSQLQEDESGYPRQELISLLQST